MADKRLVSWIREAMNKGYSKEKVYNYLLQNDYDSYAIKTAFDEIDGHALVHNKKFYIILSSIIALILLVSIAFAFMNSTNEPKEVLFNENQKNSDDNADHSIINDSNQKGIDSEKSDNPLNGSDEVFKCSNTQCFNEYFQECKPASLLLSSGSVVNYYKVIGKKDGLCEVLNLIVIQAYDEEIKKHIVCKLNTTKPFGLAMQEEENCQKTLLSSFG